MHAPHWLHLLVGAGEEAEAIAEEVDSVGELAEETADATVESMLAMIIQIAKDFAEHLPLIVIGVIVLFLTWVTAKIFDKFARKLLSHSHLRTSLQDLIERLVLIAIWTMGLLLAAMVVFPGLTPAKALAGLGLSSIAIGFAFKDIFENFFAGILILWRFPFENGDFIECEGITGKVEDVTIRNTMIRQVSGELVVVPNATIFKNPVNVLTSREIRRVTVIAGVAYDEDVDESRQVIEKAVKGCSTVSDQEDIQIFAQEFAASSINFEVTWWTGATPVEIRKSRDEVVAAVKRALDDAGIEIPFPYRTLTFKEPLKTLAATESKGSGSADE